MTPHEFIHKWTRANLSERSAYQQHFLDLCDLLGQPWAHCMTHLAFTASHSRRKGGPVGLDAALARPVGQRGELFGFVGPALGTVGFVGAKARNRLETRPRYTILTLEARGLLDETLSSA